MDLSFNVRVLSMRSTNKIKRITDPVTFPARTLLLQLFVQRILNGNSNIISIPEKLFSPQEITLTALP